MDLGEFYTSPLGVAAHPSFGPFRTDHDFRDLPAGLVTWLGIPFDVRGVIQLTRSDPRGGLFQRGWDRWLRRVEGIPVGRRCARIHVIHGCVFAEDEGKVIGAYVCEYADGARVPLPIVYGGELRSYLGGGNAVSLETPRGRRVWQGMGQGTSPSPQRVGVFLSTYPNPRPGEEIVRVHFESALTRSAPFLIAMSVE